MNSIDASPLVSCIMPTANRRRFVPWAIEYFLRQDYLNKELIILDDGNDSVADLVPADLAVRYVRSSTPLTLGAKRNACVEAARGDLIMHWDDDDWMASDRIRYQVGALLEGRAEVCGLARMLFYEPSSTRGWLYRYPSGRRPWLAGGSLLYARDFWRRAPFPPVTRGEDTRFIWTRSLAGAVSLPRHDFYVAIIHQANTSPKRPAGAFWSPAPDVGSVLGGDALRYSADRGEPEARLIAAPRAAVASMAEQGAGDPAFAICMVVHNTLAVTKMATLRTLRHSRGQDARLVVVDNASNDGTEVWLRTLAARGDIDLIRNERNIGHGPGLELARRSSRSRFVVTLDSDAFPLDDEWLPRLRARLSDRVKVCGILHHRGYVHPSCLMIERATLDELGLSFLNEKDQPSRFDVAERLSHEIRRHGFALAGLERSEAIRRGSVSEPVYLGSSYAGLVYHQWYTTRAVLDRTVDDVPREALGGALAELLAAAAAEVRPLTVAVGLRATASEPQRLRNAVACLQALNLQNLERWRYRLIVVEQDERPRHERVLAPLADRYVFQAHPGPYNRSAAFNRAASLPGHGGVLCLIDADLLVGPTFLSTGLSCFDGRTRALLPYREVAYLDGAASERAVRDRLAHPLAPLDPTAYGGRLFDTSQGGCIWLDAALYDAIGGHDERFQGWGCEDRDFWDRLSAATSIARLDARILHLHHPRARSQNHEGVINQRLYERTVRERTDRTRSAGSAVAAATPCPSAERTGKRRWEQWHRWPADRIEAIADDEAKVADRHTVRRGLADRIVQLGGSLLDVGCGPGALWHHFERHRPSFRWQGVDVTRAMLAVARRRFPHVAVQQGDAAHLPFADASFDVVLLRHVLEHLPAELMEGALREAARLARRAIVLSFYVAPISGGASRARTVGEGFLETRWSTDALEAPLAAAGWDVRERRTLSDGRTDRDVVWIASPSSAPAGQESEPYRISIVMPTYRRGHVIAETIEGVQCQTYRNWELILVDNAGDLSQRFADGRIRIVRHAAKASASYARNEGLRYATGDLVCFFDDDDEMYPHYLERFADAFRLHPRASMVRCGMIVSDGSTNYTYATPECCLRRAFATATWTPSGPAQDQLYFRQIIDRHRWTEAAGDIVVVQEPLCRANTDPRGGLRAGHY